MKNIFYQASQNFKKFIKGYFMLIGLGISFFLVTLTIESCSNNGVLENNVRKQARNNFLNSANIGLSSLKTVNVKTINNSKNNTQYSKSSSINTDLATISIYSQLGRGFTEFETLNNVASFKDLISIKGIEFGVGYVDGRTSDNILSTQVPINSYSISIESAKQSLEPTLLEAKNYLRLKGLTDNDIQNLLIADIDGPAMSESDLIPAVMQLIAEEERQNSISSLGFSNVFIQSANASEIGECAGDALGVSALAAVVDQGLHTQAGKALLKKAIRKVASRALGWVGAAIFAYEFMDCMGWLD
jgi:hypothetical protein